ncbi:MAG: hypothetical protein ACRCY4_03465 [Brevinema sp.]
MMIFLVESSLIWWDWDIEKIYHNCSAIYNADIEALLAVTNLNG